MLQVMRSDTQVSEADYAGRMEHYVRKEPIPYESAPAPVRSGSWFRRTFRGLRITLRGLMNDRKPSPYSSLSPRRMDGTHTDIFPFNSSGGGAGGGGAG
jgi:hypothetical protein